MNFQMFKLYFEKAERGTRDQISNIHWIIEKAREFQKNIYFCFIDYAKAFDCVDHNKLLLPDLHTDFSRGRSGGLIFSSLEEFSSLL